MMNGRPIIVLRSEFNRSTFKRDGTLVPPTRDRRVRNRAELALVLDSPDPRASVAEAISCPRAAHRANRPEATEMPPGVTLSPRH